MTLVAIMEKQNGRLKKYSREGAESLRNCEDDGEYFSVGVMLGEAWGFCVNEGETLGFETGLFDVHVGRLAGHVQQAAGVVEWWFRRGVGTELVTCSPMSGDRARKSPASSSRE